MTVIRDDMTDNFHATWHCDSPLALRFARDAVHRYVRQQRIVIAKCEEKPVNNGDVHTLNTTVEHAPKCPCFDCTGIHPQPLPPEASDPLDYYRAIIENGGGIITLPDHLGVLVGPDPRGTPAGWLFIKIKGLTPQVLHSWVDAVRAGRSAWPGNARFEMAQRKN